MSDKAPFEIVKTTLNAVSIKDNKSGEIIHNPIGPWKEAHSLYVEQSALKRRLSFGDEGRLILFDVGLGAGFNALAALSEFKKQRAKAPCRPLHIVSFENDLRLFRFCIDHINHFPEIASYQPLMTELLEKGSVSVPEEGFHWTLRSGNFVETIQQETLNPEIIFFDPYSPKVNPNMWSLEVFSKLFELANANSLPCVLMTYSVATGIRTGLLLAGFFVGIGPSSGEKRETTFASTRLSELVAPLDDRWLLRWHRSHNRLPPGFPFSQDEAKASLLSHRQWVPSANT